MKLTPGSRTFVCAAALLTSLALAGCGSSTPQASQPTAPGGPAGGTTGAAPTKAPSAANPAKASAAGVNSMNVITRAEASSGLGQTVRAPVRGKATVEGGVAAVFYGPSVPVGTNPDVPVPNSVRVVLVTGPQAQKWFDDYRGKVHSVALTGLGDKAYYDGYASVSAMKDGDYVRIAVAGKHAISLPAEKRLVADALRRM